jgi:hypothetical protein
MPGYSEIFCDLVRGTGPAAVQNGSRRGQLINQLIQHGGVVKFSPRVTVRLDTGSPPANPSTAPCFSGTQHTVKMVSDISVPSRDVTYQTRPGRELFNYSRPGRVW